MLLLAACCGAADLQSTAGAVAAGLCCALALHYGRQRRVGFQVFRLAAADTCARLLAGISAGLLTAA